MSCEYDEYAGEVCEYDDGESAEVPEVSLEEVRGAIDSLPESYRCLLYTSGSRAIQAISRC